MNHGGLKTNESYKQFNELYNKLSSCMQYLWTIIKTFKQSEKVNPVCYC